MNLENLVVSKGKKKFKKTKPASMRYVKGMQKLTKKASNEKNMEYCPSKEYGVVGEEK